MRTKMMFKLVLLICVFLAQPISAGEKNRVPVSTKLDGLTQGHLEAKDLRGQTTVVEFFAAWCEGCSDVMKKLEKIAPKDKQFAVVSVDEEKSAAHGYFKRKPDIRHLKKKAYFDADANLAEALGVESLPAIFVIDKTGRVIKKIHGHPSKAQYKQIRKLLKR